jgi:ABC-type nickel/cobalt efflux system permease component RcnA
MITFLLGFIASLAHVVTGPDHLAAVTPLAIDSRKKSWIIGFSWGAGHTIGMLLIGLLFVLLKKVLPIEAISKYSETIIGCMLIIIGTWALLRTYLRHKHGKKPHAHFHSKPYLYAHIHSHSHKLTPVFRIEKEDKQRDAHNHDHYHNHEHSHGHDHSHNHFIYNPAKENPTDHDHGHEHEKAQVGKVSQNAITAFSIGIIHGFAGFSHLVALLPSLALPTILASIVYISAFASGTIFTMVIFAFIMGLVAFKSEEKNKQEFLKWFTFSGALLAIIVGIIWLFHPL